MPSCPHDTIDDAAFLVALENFDGSPTASAAETQAIPDRGDPLNRTFPFAGHGAAASEPYPAFADLPPYQGTDAESAMLASDARAGMSESGRTSRRSDAPTLAVALVFVMGLAAGASAAAIVFYDRAAQIVAAWTGPHS
ncbi:MAG: hypothetical protein HY048_20010 [Acidobacteria bacterium]|nr:hypothetical protein [Acidobacteriota bacterium]